MDCKTESPETDPRYPLVLNVAGWRRFEREENGTKIVDWRCRACWHAYKRKTLARTQQNIPSLEALRSKGKPEGGGGGAGGGGGTGAK